MLDGILGSTDKQDIWGEPTDHRLRLSDGAFSYLGLSHPPPPECLDDLAEQQVMGGNLL
jgi:hypothetical protein